MPALRELLPVVRAAGFDELWSAEVGGFDGLTPLAVAAAWDAQVRLGTAILPVSTRGPALLAMSAAAMADVAPGRFTLGLGASSPTIVAQWNGMEFDRPFAKVRDTLRFVRRALAGEKVDAPELGVSGFRLERPPAQPPPIVLAALRPRMLALAGSEADGVVLNWLAVTDVATCLAEVANPASRVIARIFVCPTADANYARTVGRRMIAAYLTVPAYAAFHQWLGRGQQLAAMASAWAAGDRRGAVAAIPDAVVDELLVHGTPERCGQRLQEYLSAGVDVAVAALIPTPELADPGRLAAVLAGMGTPR